MPRSSKVKIRATFNQRSLGQEAYAGASAGVSVGRSVNQFSTSNMGELPEVVAKHLARTVESTNRYSFFSNNAPFLATKISNGIDSELRRVGQFMATHLIGIRSEDDYGQSTEVNAFEGSDIELDWRNLADLTVRKKSAHKSRFFIETGDLKAELKAKAGSGLVELNTGFKTGRMKGGVQHGSVTIRPYYYQNDRGQRVFKIADIEINLLAGVSTNVARDVLTRTIFNQNQSPAGDMPALARMMGLSPAAIKKLEGGVIDRNRKRRRNRSGYQIGSVENTFSGERVNFYRPMIEPTLSFFFQVKVPRAIERVISRYRRGVAEGGLSDASGRSSL